MTDKGMSRRRVLAVVGAALTAGCGSQGSGGNSSRFARGNGQGNRERTPARVPTATDVERTTQENVLNLGDDDETSESVGDDPLDDDPLDDETIEDPDTPERTETPSAADSLEAARQHLQESVSAYTAVENVDSIEEQRASRTGFDGEPVREALTAAEQDLDTAATMSESDEDETAIEDLRSTIDAMERLIDCQELVVGAFEEFAAAETAAFEEEFGDASAALNELEQRIESASQSFDRLDASTDPAAIARIEGLSEQQIQRKLTRLDEEIAALETLHSPMVEVADGIERFARGVDSYLGQAWGPAVNELFASLGHFETAAIDLIGVSGPNTLGNKLQKLRESADALDDGTDYMIESARAGQNGSSQDREDRLRDALNTYQQVGRVGNLPSVNRLENEG